MVNTTCVGNYLTQRLEQLGVSHLFAVPGDYTSDLLAIVDDQSTITRVGTCNELNAGYAADGYARANGLGVVAVTTGVGALSLVNAVAGAWVEHVPVVVIVGTLSNTKLLDTIDAAELFHHTLGAADTNVAVYRTVTAAQERISDPLMAPMQIDRALITCISQKRPVLIEILEDCYYMPCADPQGSLAAVPAYTPWSVLTTLNGPQYRYAAQIVGAVNGAATAAFNLLKAARRPLLWVGAEVAIYDLELPVEQLLQAVRAPYVSSLKGKSVLSESTAGYVGVYNGVFTAPYAQEFVSGSDCIIAVGVINDDLNFLSKTPNPSPGNPAQVFASGNCVKVGTQLFANVSLENFITALMQLIADGYAPTWPSLPPLPPPPSAPSPSAALTYDNFFATLDAWLTPNNIVVADVGLSTFGGSSFLSINRQNGFLVQSLWGSIGWSVPAGLGAAYTPGARAVVIVGDGAFKLTCQEISTMVQNGLNPVVFVLDNAVYAVEQMLLDPTPFEAGSTAGFEPANVLQRWDYEALMVAFSNSNPSRGMGASVATVNDLQTALSNVSVGSGVTWLIQVSLGERDYPAAWAPFVPQGSTDSIRHGRSK
jgi:indolepyruvate decarboxylase